MFLRASVPLVDVVSRFKEFDALRLKSKSFQAYSWVGKHRFLWKSGTMADGAPALTCLGKVSDDTERINPEERPVPSILHVEKQKRVREIMQSDAQNKWDECWKKEATPWDVGGVTPIIQHIVDQGQVPEGRALVPGCGSGYDVLALAGETRQVVGLDISVTANSRAKKNALDDPRGKWVQFLLDDFFTYKSETPFTFIFDYTFFCAIDPALRPSWAAKMAELLSPDGELMTLMFPVDQFEGGPPFAVSVQAYEEVLNPVGLVIVSCEDNALSLPPRKGREIVARWRKTSSKI